MKKLFFLSALATIGLSGAPPVQAQGDLAVTKTAPSTVSAGQNLTYIINLTHTGLDAVTNVDLSDPLPVGTTFVSLKVPDGLSTWNTVPYVGQSGTVDVNIARVAPRGIGGFYNFTAMGNTLYFHREDQTYGRELWKSDGTAAGTGLVKDINPGSGSSIADTPTAIGNTLYFPASDGIHGYELWKSDGTETGTVLVKDINPGSAWSSPSYFTNVGGTIYFMATDGAHGYELWKTNGTTVGTTLVKDINPSSGGYISDLINFGGKLYFIVINSNSGHELWKSDGTEMGTTLVKAIDPSNGSSSPSPQFHYLSNVGGRLYFRAYTAANGYELWKSDGTAAGTVMLKDINPGNGDSSPVGFTLVGSSVYFSANDGSHGTELWKTNGTAAGTTLVKDIEPGLESSNAADLINLGGKLYFTAWDSSYGTELWKSDGTAAGTVLVKDINPGNNYSHPSYLTIVGDTLYFSADDGSSGDELWKSNGTATGTIKVKDILTGVNGSAPFSLTNFNGTLFFRANGGNGNELWKSNGTTATTVPVRLPRVSTFEVTVKVNKDWVGTLSNTATITSNDDSNPANNSSTATTTVLDTYRPIPSINSPQAGQALTFAAFNTVTGSATDNVGVAQVLVKVLRNRDGVLQYWNGSAFTPTSAYFQATLATPGQSSTTWSYAISPALKAALDEGDYLIYAYARDAAGNQSNPVTRSFLLSNDVNRPVPTISNPTEGQTLSLANFTTVKGNATDNVGVTEVLVKVRRNRNGVFQYWNGSAFTTTSVYFQATLAAPGSTATTWSYAVSSALKSALDSGPYEILIYARDKAGNQNNALSRKFTLTSSNTVSAIEASSPSASSF